MLDGRVLAAVLTTLAAIAAAINGGGLDAQQLKSSSLSSPGDTSFASVSDSVPEPFARFFDRPEPENDARVYLEVSNWKKLSVKNAGLEAQNFTSAKVSGSRVNSDSGIKFYGFTGSVTPGKSSKIKGRAAGFYSSGVNFSGSTSVSEELRTSRIDIRDTRRTSLKIKEAGGRVDAESTSTAISSPETVEIDSFSGDITVWPRNRSMVLDGRINRLEAGEVIFGG